MFTARYGLELYIQFTLILILYRSVGMIQTVGSRSTLRLYTNTAPTLRIYLHLHTSLTQRTNRRSLGTFQKV